jgi:zinc transport system substrate-binding protein
MRRRWLVPFVAMLTAMLGPVVWAQPSKSMVVTSFYPLYEFARQVAGDRAEIMALVPAGVEPHDWEPTPQDLVLLRKARLFIYNGAGLEPWADKVLKDVASRDLVVVRATAGLSLMRVSHGHAEHDGKKASVHKEPGHARDKGALDPHVWLDPVLAQSQLEMIRAGLAKADPGNATTYAENAKAYNAKLVALHDAYTKGLAQCARRDIVVTHAAFGYLAKRYQLNQVAIAGLAPEAEPSPADLAALVRIAKQKKVKYVFFETLVSPRLAESLAREVGAQTLVLNPIEGLTADEQAAGKSYLTAMEENLRNLRTALECR